MATTYSCTTTGLVLVVEDAACGVSGHRDGMCQLALLLSSMAARRMVATAGRGQCAAYLASRRSLHKTRRGSLSSALCAWPLGVHITPRIVASLPTLLMAWTAQPAATKAHMVQPWWTGNGSSSGASLLASTGACKLIRVLFVSHGLASYEV